MTKKMKKNTINSGTDETAGNGEKERVLEILGSGESDGWVRWSLRLYDVIGINEHAPCTMLCHIIGWFRTNSSGQSKLRVNRNGREWLAVSGKEWQDRCRVPERAARRWLKQLKELSLIDIEYWKWSGFRTTHITVRWEEILKTLDKGEHRNNCGNTTDSIIGGTANGIIGGTASGNTFNIDTDINTNIITPPNPPEGGNERDYFFKKKTHAGKTPAEPEGIKNNGRYACSAVDTDKKDRQVSFIWDADTKFNSAQPLDDEWQSRIIIAICLKYNGYTLDRDYNIYRLEDIDSRKPVKVRRPKNIFINKAHKHRNLNKLMELFFVDRITLDDARNAYASAFDEPEEMMNVLELYQQEKEYKSKQQYFSSRCPDNLSCLLKNWKAVAQTAKKTAYDFLNL